MLQQLGLRVTTLNPADIPKTDLSRYNAIVVGTRAYESNDALVANNAALLDYVKQRRDDGRAIRADEMTAARASCRIRSRSRGRRIE